MGRVDVIGGDSLEEVRFFVSRWPIAVSLTSCDAERHRVQSTLGGQRVDNTAG